MNNAILLQQCRSAGGKLEPWNGIFYDMLRLTVQRHAAWARAHGWDYQVNFGDVAPEYEAGAWGKVTMILDALKRGYEYVAWLDTDAAIMDMSCDLRSALPEGAFIGAVEHNASWFAANGMQAHMNVGVLYVRQHPLAIEFMTAWAASYPGPEPRWMDQGAFNALIGWDKYAGIVARVPAEYNATVNVHQVPAEQVKVKGWHGIMPPEKRLALMQAELRDDFIRFKV
jgi:hypothetical protein